MTSGQAGPFPPNQDDLKMSDPSPVHPPTSPTLVEHLDDDASEAQATPLLLSLITGLFKLLAVAMVVYLTYYFTTTFAHHAPVTAPLTDEQVVLAKKAEDLRSQGKKLLSSYGWVDPVTKSKVHVPIDRAMELLLAENARPAPPAAAPASAAPGASVVKPGIASSPGAPTANVAPAPAVATAPAGMAPEQMYRMVCMACHDADGKGKIVKLAMPSIPDLTDPKFHASRTDAELTHSILEGKPSTVNGVQIPLMLSMKDKLALAHTDVKDMVAFMRAFKGGKQVVSATPSGPAGAVPTQLAQALAPAALPATPTPAAATTSPRAGSVASMATKLTTTQAPVASPLTTSPIPTSPAAASARPPAATAPVVTNVAALPPALPAAAGNATAMAAAQAEKLRAASAIFNTTCIACHGPDGRGTLVRAAMPPIPDFTSRDWHSTRTSSQLASSILEGKGTLMPPWNTKITPEQARNLVLYVRNFGGADFLAKEFEGETAASGPSLAEFDNKLQSLRQQFDNVEKQLQALPTAR
jgi:mono/diheme cytochrome c family protein